MSSEEKPSIDTLIDSWLVKWGEEKVSKGGIPYYSIERTERLEALNSLMQTILGAGYGRDDVDSVSLLKKIHGAMTPEVYDTQKLADWRDILDKIWKFLITKEFANESVVKPAKEYPKQAPRLKAAPEEQDSTSDDFVPPVSKLPKNFKGFGESNPVYDEDFIKVLEAMKDE